MKLQTLQFSSQITGRRTVLKLIDASSKLVGLSLEWSAGKG